MTPETLKLAIREAQRFIAIAENVPIETIGKYSYIKNPCKEAAACKRASMDLTRNLANMRKTRWGEK